MNSLLIPEILLGKRNETKSRWWKFARALKRTDRWCEAFSELEMVTLPRDSPIVIDTQHARFCEVWLPERDVFHAHWVGTYISLEKTRAWNSVIVNVLDNATKFWFILGVLGSEFLKRDVREESECNSLLKVLVKWIPSILAIEGHIFSPSPTPQMSWEMFLFLLARKTFPTKVPFDSPRDQIIQDTWMASGDGRLRKGAYREMFKKKHGVLPPETPMRVTDVLDHFGVLTTDGHGAFTVVDPKGS